MTISYTYFMHLAFFFLKLQPLLSLSYPCLVLFFFLTISFHIIHTFFCPLVMSRNICILGVRTMCWSFMVTVLILLKIVTPQIPDSISSLQISFVVGNTKIYFLNSHNSKLSSILFIFLGKRGSQD